MKENDPSVAWWHQGSICPECHEQLVHRILLGSFVHSCVLKAVEPVVGKCVLSNMLFGYNGKPIGIEKLSDDLGFIGGWQTTDGTKWIDREREVVKFYGSHHHPTKQTTTDCCYDRDWIRKGKGSGEVLLVIKRADVMTKFSEYVIAAKYDYVKAAVIQGEVARICDEVVNKGLLRADRFPVEFGVAEIGGHCCQEVVDMVLKKIKESGWSVECNRHQQNGRPASWEVW